MFNFLPKLFGNYQNRYLKSLQPKIQAINSLEKEFESLSAKEIKEKFTALRHQVIDKKIDLDQALTQSFALTREAAKRTLKQRHFDVQLMGGIALHEGKVIEMKTGEGKTLVATLPAALNAMTGKGVSIVTVNDYLAKRDAVWMGQVYHFLGLSVGCITQNEAYIYDPDYKKENNTNNQAILAFRVEYDFLRPVPRKEAYGADVTYGTNNTFGFDYLKDNLAQNLEEIVQRPFNYAIIDEVDSILIDEARTPLIISAPDQEAAQTYRTFAKIIPKLIKDIDYKVDEKFHAVTLTEKGIKKVEELLNDPGIYKRGDVEKIFHLEQSLKAFCLFHKDKDYIVKDGQVIIIDEFTGRLMPDIRY
jgi:preprotein translocase subunit SecA